MVKMIMSQTNGITLFSFALSSRIKKIQKSDSLVYFDIYSKSSYALRIFFMVVLYMINYRLLDAYTPPRVDVSHCRLVKPTSHKPHNVLLINNWRFVFFRFELCFDLPTYVNGLDNGISLLDEITELVSYRIC